MTGERQSSWFPLALLGFALIGLAALDLRTPHGWFAYTPAARPGQQFLYGMPQRYSDYVVSTRVEVVPWGSRWQIALALGFAGAVIWYAVRNRPVPARRLAAVVVAGVAVLALSAGLEVWASGPQGRVLAGAVGGPLVVVAAVAGLWAYFGTARRRLALGVCLVCLTLGIFGLAAAVSTDLVDPVTAAFGLAVPAWCTRSVVLAVVTVVFLAAAVPFAGATLGLLAPGAVLLGGAIAVLVAARRPTAGAG
ncbi:MAG TPA: hypothetical protein VHC18_14170 [Amycolatopsis sp.]|nr:hypothetical protein [Amycolatopsis sp.]